MTPHVPLQEVTEFVLDGTHGSPERVPSGVPLFSAEHVKDGRLNLDTARFTSDAEYRAFNRRLSPKAGDVLLTIVGTIGRAAVLDHDPVAVFQRSVAVIRPLQEQLNSRFLLWVIGSRSFSDQLRSATNQSSQAGVYLGRLKKLTIPLPPLTEQRRIAAILDKADELRAKRRTALEQLNGLTQSVFLEMFGDPVLNRKGWETRTLKEVGTVDRGVSKHRPRNAPELLGGPYPFVQTGDVANCDGYIRDYQNTYSEAGLRQSKMWAAGTLCITIAANIGKTGVLTFNACFPDSVVGFRAEDPATVLYVRTWLSFLQSKLEDAAPESAQKNINLAVLRDLLLPVPPLSLQRVFAARVEQIEEVRLRTHASEESLGALFTSLQHQAFSGAL